MRIIVKDSGMRDLYSDLGLEKGASADEIKFAYRKLAQKHHPDRGGDKEAFQKIQEAYDVLGDKHKRAEYDETGNVGSASSLDSMALNSLIQAANAAMEANDYAVMDYVSLVNKHINFAKNKLEQRLIQIDRNTKKIEILVTKLEGPAFVAPLNKKLELLNAEKASIEQNKKVCYRSIEILDSCKFTGDIQIGSQHTVFSGTLRWNA